MSTQTPWMMATAAALVLLLQPDRAAALTSCSNDAECKAESVCHGGTCVPKAQQCKDDGGCKAHQRCDFTCPHGAWATGGGTVSVEPAPDGGSSNGSSSGSSGSSSSGSGSSGSSGDAEKVPAGSGESGGGAPEQGKESPPCPKEVGICVVDVAKVKPSAACEALCKVAGQCGGMGEGTSSSPPSTGAGGAPAPGGQDGDESKEGGSSGFAPGKEGEGGGSDDSGEAGATDEGDKAKEPTPEEIAASTEACATMCTIWELEAVAKAELAAVQTCVAGLADKTCDAIEKGCAKEGDAMEAAMEAAQDALELVLASYGGQAELANNNQPVGTTGAGGTGGPAENKSSDGEAAAQSGGAANTGTADSGGGCSAGSGGQPGMWLLMLALLPLMRRRRAEA